jgi:hypothetical protein
MNNTTRIGALRHVGILAATLSAVALAAFADTARAASVTLQAGAGGQSNEIIQEAMLVQESGNNNYGGRDNFEVGVLGNGRVRTTVMRFDVPTQRLVCTWEASHNSLRSTPFR